MPTKHLDWILKHFDGVEKNGDGYKALCPVHDDSNPSLAIKEGDDGRILLYCHAGCPSQTVCDLADLRLSDLMPGAKPRPKIVAKYDYVGEDGSLLFQVCRMEPKSFRQRRPKKGGGWEWKVPEETRVLYNLPKVKATRQRVLVVEGEKDADRLNKLGFVATTAPCGAGKWLDSYTEALRGKHVAIIPDNDEVGWEHASKISRELSNVAKTIRVVELPDLPEKGDVSDWLDAGGTRKQLKELIASAGGPEVAHAVLEPLKCRSVETVQQFPTDAFPSPLARYIRRIAKALPCPEDFPGVMMLATLGAAIGRKRCIRLKKRWTEYPLLWAAVVARSGDRKSPAFNKIMEPVRKQHSLLRKRHIEEVDAWKSSEDKADTPKPVLTQIVTTDSTVEALKDVLATSRNGVLFTADELSGWVRSMGQYKRGGGNDRQAWLSIWAGEPIVCNRRCQESIDIPEPFVSVVGGIQPDALSDIIDVRREDGFAARVLFAYPQPIPHKQWTEDSVGNSAEYSGIWKQLYELPGNKEIPLSKAAKAVWVKWVNEHRENEPPDILRAAWSKAEGHCARFALILHLCRVACNKATEGKIGREAMEGAVKLIEYFLSHAAKVYRSSAVKQDDTRIGRALKWIKQQGGTVTARMVQQAKMEKSSDDAKTLLYDLEEHGHGKVTKGAHGKVEFRLSQT